MVCHPSCERFGGLIYNIFPFDTTCCCNFLHRISPDRMEELAAGHFDEAKHVHKLVLIHEVLSEKNRRKAYVDSHTDMEGAMFFPMRSKMHMLNVCLYLMGRRSSSGVGCHNSNMGLTQGSVVIYFLYIVLYIVFITQFIKLN